MTLKEWQKSHIDDNISKRVYEPVQHNPIRPVYQNGTERTFLRDKSVDSNAIGRDNTEILKTQCYDSDGR